MTTPDRIDQNETEMREPDEKELEQLEALLLTRQEGYSPRPRWQLVLAWILVAAVLIGIAFSVYLLDFSPIWL